MMLIIKLTIIMIVISIFEFYISKHDSVISSVINNKDVYLLEIPRALSFVYITIFNFGLLLFIFWTMLYIEGDPSITIVKLIFCTIFAILGLLANIYANKCKIMVNHSVLTIYKLFKRNPIIISIQEPDLIYMTDRKSNIRIYRNDSCIVKINHLSDNYNLLYDSLKSNNLI